MRTRRVCPGEAWVYRCGRNRFAKKNVILKTRGMRLKSIVACIEGLLRQQKAYDRRHCKIFHGKGFFPVWAAVICVVLLLSGCHEKEPSAREVLEQVRANMEGMSECVFTARVEMVMSVYEETTRLEAESRVRASFSGERATESVELYRDQARAEAFTYQWEDKKMLAAFRDATDIGRFLKDTEVFFIEGEEDAETIYTIEGLAKGSSLGGMEDMKRMAAFLPVLEPADFAKCAQEYSFPVRIKVDRETLLPAEVTVNVSEAAKEPVQEGICALGISEEQVQAGSCVITYDYEEIRTGGPFFEETGNHGCEKFGKICLLGCLREIFPNLLL